MKKQPINMGMMPAPAGEFIREQVFEPLDLSISRAAEVIKVRRATLSDIVNGKVRLNSNVALRLEKAFGVSMDVLLRMQLAYEVAQARKHAEDVEVEPYKVSALG